MRDIDNSSNTSNPATREQDGGGVSQSETERSSDWLLMNVVEMEDGSMGMVPARTEDHTGNEGSWLICFYNERYAILIS